LSSIVMGLPFVRVASITGQRSTSAIEIETS
jgi:hypothetical protein